MDHIFLDSDEITFGSSSLPPREPRSQPSRTHSARPPQRTPAPVISRPPVSREETVFAPKEQELPLKALVAYMKPSFLPHEEDSSLLRMVILSSPWEKDPFILLRRDATTILVWSGFGTTTKAGNSYMTFPDMRLIFSEKERIHAWVLLDDTIDVSYFEHILPSLDFPPIYGTRDVIAKFRNSIRNQEFLEKCRFFEIFSPTTPSRRIGDIELSPASKNKRSGLLIGSASSGVLVALGSYHDPLSKESWAPLLTENVWVYLLEETSIQSGEIMTFRGKNSTKHSLKYSLDTFYVDKKSIWVVASYTLGDRELLSENGILLFTLEEDPRNRSIKGHIFIDSRGFVHAHEMMSVHKEILKGIRATYEKCIIANPTLERSELVQTLRREITKYCFLLTGRTPVVMPVITDRSY